MCHRLRADIRCVCRVLTLCKSKRLLNQQSCYMYFYALKMTQYRLPSLTSATAKLERRSDLKMVDRAEDVASEALAVHKSPPEL
jgi:hypothetical protein